jgi:hypothetical protein
MVTLAAIQWIKAISSPEPATQNQENGKFIGKP